MTRRVVLLFAVLLCARTLSAAPLTLADLQFGSGWILPAPSTSYLDFAEEHGLPGTTITFDQPFTGTWSFGYQGFDGWPVRWAGGGLYLVPEDGFPGYAPRSISVNLNAVSLLDFALLSGAAGPDRIYFYDMVFTPDEGMPFQEMSAQEIPVPEPGTLVLLGSGMIAGWIRRRR